MFELNMTKLVPVVMPIGSMRHAASAKLIRLLETDFLDIQIRGSHAMLQDSHRQDSPGTRFFC